ncbi:MbtH family protein [Caulobacter segnis]
MLLPKIDHLTVSSVVPNGRPPGWRAVCREFVYAAGRGRGARYVVLVNSEQHSLWPAAKAVPEGWRKVGAEGSKTECLQYVETHWTDMRPLSLRERAASDAMTLVRASLAKVSHVRPSWVLSRLLAAPVETAEFWGMARRRPRIPLEARIVAGAGRVRRREFAAGRACAPGRLGASGSSRFSTAR